jgi:hypothetical protein
MGSQEVRLELMKVLITKASQVGIVNPDVIIEACSQFEKYVVGSSEGGDSLASPTSKPKQSPHKGKAKSKAQDGSPTPVSAG